MKAIQILLAVHVSILGSSVFAYVGHSSGQLNDGYLDKSIRENNILDLDHLVSFLPEDVRLNFVLKHGIQRLGERGHLVEKKVSQSADPELPRAILWDETTGYSVSFNGGGEQQTANQRLDILSFDSKKKTFNLKKVDFPLTENQIRQEHSPLVVSDVSCQECHGARQRPIFAMYPDWPAFYGSDNDELNNLEAAHQEAEIKDYENFKETSALSSLRYNSLYDEKLIQQAYGMSLWSTFPYRQNTSEEPKNISRSFSFRPGLRLGIVYNRLNADAVFQTMKTHKNYNRYAGLVLNSLLQCGWDPKYPKTRTIIAEMAKKDLAHTPQWIGQQTLQLSYAQIWELFGLKINDVDIRYSYNHEGYQNTDASKKIMSPGYIGKYFNAYFDGTATSDELIIAKLLEDLSTVYVDLKGSYKLHGLVEKYQHFEDRFRYDKQIFENYDRLGKWFPIPYADVVFKQHHRETYDSKMKAQYDLVCQKTRDMLKQQAASLGQK